jgi:ATP-dependent DNA helicase RecG
MAPTEILAEQHFRKLIGWLEPAGHPRGLRVAWLTGSQKAKERARCWRWSPAARRAGGGHACRDPGQGAVQATWRWPSSTSSTALAWRSAWRCATRCRRLQLEPHLLMMSATPIPRTLAMSYYADLDVSTIDELPPGRTPIVTKVVADSRRDEVIERIRAQVAQGGRSTGSAR